jgi:HemY protein
MTLFRNLLLWLLLALSGALLAQALIQDAGFVLVRYLGTEVETTLAGGLLMLFVVLAAAWALWKLATLPFRLWRSRRERFARARLADGLDALHRGEHAKAESLLEVAAQDAQFAAAARVAAARAAHARGDRDAALAHLHALPGRHAATRALALADLALADGRIDDARAALATLAADNPPPRAATLRAVLDGAADDRTVLDGTVLGGAVLDDTVVDSIAIDGTAPVDADLPPAGR